MSAAAEIKTYLATRNRDYLEGLSLLQSYANKPATCEMLMQKKNVPMLEKLLAGILDKLSGVVAAPAVEPSNPVMQKKSAAVTPAPAAEIKISQREATEIRLMGELRSVIKQIDSSRQSSFWIGRDIVTGKEKPLSKRQIEQRRKIAELLVSNPDGLNVQTINLLEDIKYFKLYGQERNPVKHDKPKEEPILKQEFTLNDVENCRKLISKLKSKIKSATDKLPTLPPDKQAELINDSASWKLKLEQAETKYTFFKKQLNHAK